APCWRPTWKLEQSVRECEYSKMLNLSERGCDAPVLSSRFEGYGGSVQNALCCGLPALVSRTSSIGEPYAAALGHPRPKTSSLTSPRGLRAGVAQPTPVARRSARSRRRCAITPGA